jgi:hypothetical protein
VSALPTRTWGRPAEGWFEVANAEPGQGGLYPVHNARAFSHQAFALPVRPLGVLFGNRWHARHAAMAPFPTQPPQEPPLEQFGVEPVGFTETQKMTRVLAKSFHSAENLRVATASPLLSLRFRDAFQVSF